MARTPVCLPAGISSKDFSNRIARPELWEAWRQKWWPRRNTWEDIHKPRWQCSWGGRGVSQMTILLHKPYLVKVTTKGEGGQKYPKIWPRGLWMTPNANTANAILAVWILQRRVIRRWNGNFTGFSEIFSKIAKKFPMKRNSHFSGKWQKRPTRIWNLT